MSRRGRNNGRAALNAAYRGRGTYKPPRPPNALLIEAKQANTLAHEHPERYIMGEPLPGRSALDKARREGRSV